MRTLVDAFVFAFSLRIVGDRFIEQSEQERSVRRSLSSRLGEWLRGASRRLTIF